MEKENIIPTIPLAKEIEDEDFPGYPSYPPEEDIYGNYEEVDIMPDTKQKKQTEHYGKKNEKDFKEDKTGEDLDIPGSELDDLQEYLGTEDEENNYYSLGADSHESQEEHIGD